MQKSIVNGVIGPKKQLSVNLGPGRTGQIFVYFAKKSVTSSLRQVRPVIFRSTKFCQGLPNFTDAVVLPQSRTNFCQA